MFVGAVSPGMATREKPVAEAEPEMDTTALPEVLPYQSVIRLAHQRSLERA